VLDCLEFDDHLRHVDVLDDVAFLAMDLERLGSPELAEQLVAGYREFAGDPAPPALLHQYLAYRAFVRVKVACLRAAQGDAEAAELASAYADVALRHLRLGKLLALGETAVLDASWSAARHRRLATEAAEAASSPMSAVRCEVEEAAAKERIAARTATLSDATPEIAHRMTEDADPWPEAHPLDTGGTPRESIALALACLVPGHRKSPAQRHSGPPGERTAGARVESSGELHTDREAG
jgi:predicted kinase